VRCSRSRHILIIGSAYRVPVAIRTVAIDAVHFVHWILRRPQSVFIADVRSKRALPLAAREFEAGLAPPASYLCKPLVRLRFLLRPQVLGVRPWTPACLGSAKASPWGLPFGPAFGCPVTASCPGRRPSGERRSSHSAPSGRAAPGEFVFACPKKSNQNRTYAEVLSIPSSSGRGLG
jgi:hypothetical protein